MWCLGSRRSLCSVEHQIVDLELHEVIEGSLDAGTHFLEKLIAAFTAFW